MHRRRPNFFENDDYDWESYLQERAEQKAEAEIDRAESDYERFLEQDY